MGRKSSFAGIYLLHNIYNSKVYIGESGNVLRRLSEHRCSTNSPIYKMVLQTLFLLFLNLNLLNQERWIQIIVQIEKNIISESLKPMIQSMVIISKKNNGI